MFKKLINWSGSEFSELPWRKKRTLYRTLVSEIMLQQTTVSTVLKHFEKFISEYPNIKSLADATEEQVTMSWKGLGYYRRARNLRKAAIDIQNNFKGKIPTNYESLLEINGIGPYTASALIGIGKNKRALAVDANLERVLARIYGIKIEKGPKLHKEIHKRFEDGKILKDLEELGPRNINEALMDLGRTWCQARKSECDLCPLSRNCVAYKSSEPLAFPIISKKTQESFDLELVRIVVTKGKKVLSYQKHEKEWLSGQWELPTFVLSTTDQGLRQYPALKVSKKIDVKSLKAFKTAITKYKITNRILRLSEAEFVNLKLKGNFQFVASDPKKTNHATSTLKVFKKIDL
ncbi:MAG: A/G-specific adenine glycosylase [Bacteriovoracaceae bacterium]|nr:A/G-specific adenine glycosylase [Bacteriovoracaceae bacterium]